MAVYDTKKLAKMSSTIAGTIAKCFGAFFGIARSQKSLLQF